MRLKFCVVCGSKDVQQHHWLPLSAGGSNDENNLISLCPQHHGEFHSVRFNAKQGKLVSEGIMRAKASGRRLGPKPPMLHEFGESSSWRTPRETAWIHLFAGDLILLDEMVKLRWIDVIGDEVQLPFRTVKLSSPTKQAIAEAVRHEGLSGAALMMMLCPRKRGDGTHAMSTNHLTVTMYRLRGGPKKFKQPERLDKRKPLALTKSADKGPTLIKQRTLVPGALRKKYGFDVAQRIVKGYLTEQEAIPLGSWTRAEAERATVDD